MADGRKNNGGHSTKGFAGRKGKSEEQKLVEKLSPFENTALQALRSNVEAGEPWAIKLFFEYMYGKPKQSTDITSGGDKVSIPISKWI